MEARQSTDKQVFLSPIFYIRYPLSKEPPKAPKNKQLEKTPIKKILY